MREVWHNSLAVSLAMAVSAVAVAQPSAPAPGHSDPTFQQPSLAPGVDYVLPTEAQIKETLDRIRDHFVRATSYRVIDTETGKPITDFTHPIRTAGIDSRPNDWDYPMGVVLAGMLLDSEVTGDESYANYALKNFNFYFDHQEYFQKQAGEFGPQMDGLPRLVMFHELDDCGAMGAALVAAYCRKPDPRYRAAIERIADHVLHKQMRMEDGTLARPRPQPVSLWADDLYMAVPFLARMGKLTGERKYYDDAARQVVQYADRLLDKSTGLYDHAWFENTPYDPRFYWGRADGWAIMASAELLSVMPEDHPERARIMDLYSRNAQALAGVQSGSGMWHQLLNREDSYLESSATAMFTYAIARGVNRGWLPPTYAPVAQAGWQALSTRVKADGQIEGICVSTTAAYDAVYYYNRPTDLGALQGYGPVLLAGAEVIVMLRHFDVERRLNTFHYRVRK